MTGSDEIRAELHTLLSAWTDVWTKSQPVAAATAQWARNFLSVTVVGWFSGWTAANWIAFIAASISLTLGIYNNIAAANRERTKNEREEFHRRVATPLESLLSAFEDIQDQVLDLASEQDLNSTLEEIEQKAKAAQRKLSRGLRSASASRLCKTNDWADLGSDAYDIFIEHLEFMRQAQIAQPNHVDEAGAALERIAREVRDKIEAELIRYT